MSESRHFSMIREFRIADWFTLANAVCGTGAMFSVWLSQDQMAV